MNSFTKTTLLIALPLTLIAILILPRSQPPKLNVATLTPTSQSAPLAASTKNDSHSPLATPLSPLSTPPTWHQATTLEELDPIAQSLAEQNTPESVQSLLTGIEHIQDWPTRAALAKNLRAVSNPETLQVLLPALLNNYGRGNTILNEISDTIARLAQPETVEDLAALHWQASVQAGQGHKVLRTVASIRNPIAARGLMKVANHTESPALAAAATEALKAIDQPAY
jgi:hypothetical protein